MLRLEDFTSAEQKVWADVSRLINEVRTMTSVEVIGVEEGISLLGRLREDFYEELNQIQHEHLVLCAARWLMASVEGAASLEWYWNPRQTGDAKEPDLRGVSIGAIVISAEITASANPKGIIDGRMAKTLKKLSEMPGKRYYFVRSQTMQSRALTKVKKSNWSIEVHRLSVS